MAKKIFVYDTQRNEAKLLRRDSMTGKININIGFITAYAEKSSAKSRSNLVPINIRRGSLYIDVEAPGTLGSSESKVCVATVNLPPKIMIERNLFGKYKQIWVK
jgi:hypothetical protein